MAHVAAALAAPVLPNARPQPWASLWAQGFPRDSRTILAMILPMWWMLDDFWSLASPVKSRAVWMRPRYEKIGVGGGKHIRRADAESPADRASAREIDLSTTLANCTRTSIGTRSSPPILSTATASNGTLLSALSLASTIRPSRAFLSSISAAFHPASTLPSTSPISRITKFSHPQRLTTNPCWRTSPRALLHHSVGRIRPLSSRHLERSRRPAATRGRNSLLDRPRSRIAQAARARDGAGGRGRDVRAARQMSAASAHATERRVGRFFWILAVARVTRGGMRV
mmetsp:Transcript_5265/g.7940  ORF Transcript_5265/g.7940 Transcript_5265/m.7940 type:complete len:284 (-) Transcript_5265:813-1664(-)